MTGRVMTAEEVDRYNRRRTPKWQRFKTFVRSSGVFIISGMLVAGAGLGGYFLGVQKGYTDAAGQFISEYQQDHTEAWIEGFRSGIGGM